MALETGTLVISESQFGPDRLLGRLKSFGDIVLSEYGTGFLPAAAISFWVGTPLLVLVCGLIYVSLNVKTTINIILLPFFYKAGSKLIWPMFYFGIFGGKDILKRKRASDEGGGE